jgi:hypothetical protein
MHLPLLTLHPEEMWVYVNEGAPMFRPIREVGSKIYRGEQVLLDSAHEPRYLSLCGDWSRVERT